MKVRNGFVTNSSSSSFIIERFNEIEDTFQYIKQEYNNLKNTFNEMVKYCESKVKEQYPQLKNDGEVQYLTFATYKKDKRNIKKEDKINKELETMFGMNTWDYFNMENIDKILACDTYKNYIETFGDKAPFQIEIFKEISDEWTKDDIISWYSDKGYSTYYLASEDKIEKIIKNKVVITSECGYIPDFVVRKLGNISLRYCNHMG